MNEFVFPIVIEESVRWHVALHSVFKSRPDEARYPMFWFQQFDAFALKYINTI